MKKISIDKSTVVKLVGIGGTLLGLAGTLVSGWVGQQNQKKAVDEAVEAKFAELMAGQSAKES